MWQWRDNEHNEWQVYNDIETAIIEQAYKQSKNNIELENNLIIDLKQNLQIKTDKTKSEKPVEIRRLSIECDDARAFQNRRQRSDRFSSAPKMLEASSTSSSLGAGNWNGSQFVFEWQMKCSNLESTPWGDIMFQALEGLRLEGKKLGYEKQAQWIADNFMSVVKQSFENICRACISLYTMEGFVYRLLNTTLRDNDFSKVDTLGPLSYLLFQFNFVPEFQNLRFAGRVYRSAELTSAMTNEYKQAVGNVRSWLGLTSTSQQREIAESFSGSTVLFIIDIRETASDAARAIASLSTYPHENEVLIRAGRHFTINKVETTKSSNSRIGTLIYLTIE